MQNALKAAANETELLPNGRDTTRMAGLKTSARRSNATVDEYSVSANFW
jgi:hypothetical protein